MDGSLFNKFTGEVPNRRLRLVSYEYACTKLPRLIIFLKQGIQLRITTGSHREGYDVVTIYRLTHPEDFWVLLREDFERVKKIASDSSLRIFGSETDQEVKNRILALVKVEFSDRKDF
jgi:hypothetical protein